MVLSLVCGKHEPDGRQDRRERRTRSGMSDDDQQWYYCLQHKTVEQGQSCANSERMGPYATSAEAQRALSQAAERTDKWDHDPAWNDD